ncbi:tachykinins isoform X1 [Vanessa cardui]|uniref:tachykinins isoform X1 n=1 Tax=Vanessa cardui TaxID=171605 RepID=UPI001F141024|nr:tachykinins isoform X1 [Vanessa cardui]
MGAIKTYVLLITIQLVYVINAQEVVRRVPQGFLGVRGKKYYDYGANEYYKRKPQYFIGVKGKKDYEISEGDFKRVPMGFIGMRGKKEYLYPEFMVYPENYEYIPKHSGSLIGQIDYSTDENSNLPEYPILNEFINEYIQKLRSNLNNEVSTESSDIPDESSLSNEVEKRTNIHKFFGVRGKKSVQDKRPYDVSFRGKFIGVRGKKDLKNSGAQEIKFLLNSPWPKRRGQTGFLGMRGKKWAENDSVLDPEPNGEMAMPN